MRSISNNLLSSKTTIVEQMTQDSLQELSRLQAVAAALQERPESDEDYAEEYDETYYDDEAFLDEMEDDLEVCDELIDETVSTDDMLLDEIEQLEDRETTQDTFDSYSDEETQVSLEDEQFEDDGFDEEEYEYVDEEVGYEDPEDTAFSEDDGFEDEIVETSEPVNSTVTKAEINSAPIAPPISNPIIPPGLSSALRPPVSTPVSQEQRLKVENTCIDEPDDFDNINFDDGFDEQDEFLEDTEETSDIDDKILEEMEVDEQLLEIRSDRGSKTANSFENFEPECETKEEFEISSGADIDFDVSAEIDEFLDGTEDEELDLSVLDDVPLIETTPIKTETQQLEEENAKLRQQLAQLENEKLKQQIAEQQQKSTATQNIKLNLGVTIAQPVKPVPTQDVSEMDTKEAEQRKRWAKYAAMTTPDLWKLVYKFMTMAGVQKAPVKAKILVNEFGSHNIKRLEATYIMATKDGYTC